MKFKEAIAIFMLSVSVSVMADSHTDAASIHTEITDMESTFAITRDAVLANLDNYKKQLLSSSKVNGNAEAVKLTEKYILSAKNLVNDIYGWKRVKGEYVKAIKATYSEDELENINAWLSSKYGKVFIEKQQRFMKQTIDITGKSAEMFKAKIAPMEEKYISDVRSLD